jgi:hypothetical protein
MSEHHSETAFLRHIILYHGGDECHKLEKSIAQVQQDVRCVKRFAGLMLMLPLLAIAGVVCGVILHKNFPFNGAELVFMALCVLAVASLICLVGFVVLLTVYRTRLNRLRKQARRLVLRLLELHWGSPHSATSLNRHREFDNREASHGATEVGGYPEIASLT